VGTEASAEQGVLTQAGASVELLSSRSPDNLLHSAPYAALVLVGQIEGTTADKALQLTREFLVADKPVAAHGHAVAVLLASGGMTGRTVAVDDDLAEAVTAAGATTSREATYADDGVVTARASVDVSEFATIVAQHVGRHVDEREADDVSAMSFPASDPPPGPTTVGRVSRDRDANAG
jgi:putative intracellular protease/amidase